MDPDRILNPCHPWLTLLDEFESTLEFHSAWTTHQKLKFYSAALLTPHHCTWNSHCFRSFTTQWGTDGGNRRIIVGIRYVF